MRGKERHSKASTVLLGHLGNNSLCQDACDLKKGESASPNRFVTTNFEIQVFMAKNYLTGIVIFLGVKFVFCRSGGIDGVGARFVCTGA